MPAAPTIYGPGGVDYSAPQVIASDPGAPGLEDHHDARRRWDRAVRQHEAAVRRGVHRPELAGSSARMRARRTRNSTAAIFIVRGLARPRPRRFAPGAPHALRRKACGASRRCSSPAARRSQRQRCRRGGSAPTTSKPTGSSAPPRCGPWASRDPAAHAPAGILRRLRRRRDPRTRVRVRGGRGRARRRGARGRGRLRGRW